MAHGRIRRRCCDALDACVINCHGVSNRDNLTLRTLQRYRIDGAGGAALRSPCETAAPASHSQTPLDVVTPSRFRLETMRAPHLRPRSIEGMGDLAESISSPTAYLDSQALGHKLRAAESKPGDFETWQCIATATHIELSRKSFLARAFLRFDRKQFEVFGVLPCPAVE